MKRLLVIILGLFILASCVGVRKDTLESDMDMAVDVGASANSYDVNTTPDPTADYLLGIDAYAGSWAVQRFDIRYLLNQTPMTDAAADFAANFTGAYLYGGTFVCNEAGTIQLPVMAVGMHFTIITAGDIEVVIDTNGADGYLMDGTTNAEGKNLTNLSTSGDIAVIQYYDTSDWLITTNGWTPEA